MTAPVTDEAAATPLADDVIEQVRREVAAVNAPESWKARAEAAEARLAEVRQAAVTFRTHHGGVLEPQAEALYEAVVQVADKDKSGSEKGTDHAD